VSSQLQSYSASERKFRAGVLGATGVVGQRLVQLLDGHPMFELTEVAASERSSGKKYAEAVNWHLNEPLPASAAGLVVKGLDPTLECDFVFSALDSSVAGPAEEDFARAGYPVVSNSKNHRMDPDVPLLIPEVNAAHLEAIPLQQKNRGYGSGFIVTNPNCSTAGLVLVLKPLADAFGLECTPHNWGNVLDLAVHQHIELALPNAYWFEMPHPAEYADRPYHKHKFRIDKDGYIPAPVEPGLGYPIDHDALDKMLVRIDR